MPRFRKPFSRPYFSQGFVEIRTLPGVGPRGEWRELEVSTIGSAHVCMHTGRQLPMPKRSVSAQD